MNGSDIVESAVRRGIELPQRVQDVLQDMDGVAEGFKPRWGSYEFFNEAHDPENRGEGEYSDIESEDDYEEDEDDGGYATEWRRSPDLF